MGAIVLFCDLITEKRRKMAIIKSKYCVNRGGGQKRRNTGGNKMFEFLKKDSSKVIHVNDMDSLLGKVKLIDIREPYEYQGGSLKTAENIPMGTLLDNPAKYLKNGQTYYIMCQSGARSSGTCRQLGRQGYDVVNVAGGFGSYAGTKRK